MQQKLLPDSLPEFTGYDVAALCLPAQTVGGDFYDYTLVDRTFGFCLADVMGKGTGAAIITATVRAAIRSAVRRAIAIGRSDAVYTPGQVLASANRSIQRDLEATGSLVTVFAAYIDGPSGSVGYANAGHGLTVVVGEDTSVRWLGSHDLPLGVDPNTVWEDQQVVLRHAETLLCFSDGLLDLYKAGRGALDEIARLVQQHPDPTELTEHLRELAEWGTPGDDVTALAVRRQ